MTSNESILEVGVLDEGVAVRLTQTIAAGCKQCKVAHNSLMEFRIADTFTDCLARLTSNEQKAIKTTAFDLQLNPISHGMSFHRLDRAKDKNFWPVGFVCLSVRWGCIPLLFLSIHRRRIPTAPVINQSLQAFP